MLTPEICLATARPKGPVLLCLCSLAIVQREPSAAALQFDNILFSDFHPIVLTLWLDACLVCVIQQHIPCKPKKLVTSALLAHSTRVHKICLPVITAADCNAMEQPVLEATCGFQYYQLGSICEGVLCDGVHVAASVALLHRCQLHRDQILQPQLLAGGGAVGIHVRLV